MNVPLLDNGLRGLDVIAQRRRFLFDFCKAVLDYVANGNNSNQTILLNDRNMTEAPVRHRFHQIADRLGWRAGRHLPRHYLFDPLLK